MTKQEVAAVKALRAAIDSIAARNEYPPNPGDYSAIKTIWRSMVTQARKAKAKADAVWPEEQS